jgi:hypothetical protein
MKVRLSSARRHTPLTEGISMEALSAGTSRLRLTIDNRSQLESALDCAVDELMTKAGTSTRQGILVTRHDNRTFTVQFCTSIRPGIVMEQDLRTPLPR